MKSRFGVLALAAIVAVGVAACSEDDPVKSAERSQAASTTASSSTTTTEPPTTTIDPDAGCRSSFADAIASGLDTAKVSTLGQCTEEQWVRMQTATPIPGASLAGLCAYRSGLPATACATADSERAANEAALAAQQEQARRDAAATSIPRTTMAPRPAATAGVPATTAVPTRPTRTTTPRIYVQYGTQCNPDDDGPYYIYGPPDRKAACNQWVGRPGYTWGYNG